MKELILTVCPKCAKPVLPHNLCLNCGYYKGRQVIDVLKKLTKKEKKKKEKEMKEGEKKQKRPLTMGELSRRPERGQAAGRKQARQKKV